jgi:hypothetical protein
VAAARPSGARGDGRAALVGWRAGRSNPRAGLTACGALVPARWRSGHAGGGGGGGVLNFVAHTPGPAAPCLLCLPVSGRAAGGGQQTATGVVGASGRGWRPGVGVTAAQSGWIPTTVAGRPPGPLVQGQPSGPAGPGPPGCRRRHHRTRRTTPDQEPSKQTSTTPTPPTRRVSHAGRRPPPHAQIPPKACKAPIAKNTHVSPGHVSDRVCVTRITAGQRNPL